MNESAEGLMDPNRADPRIGRIVEFLTESPARWLRQLDQFVELLRDLEFSSDRFCYQPPPPGHRFQVITALARSMWTAIDRLEHDFEMLPRPDPSPFDQTLDVLEELRRHVLSRRLEERARHLAEDLAPDDDRELFDRVSWRLDGAELAAFGGWEASDEVLRRVILDRVAESRGKPGTGGR